MWRLFADVLGAFKHHVLEQVREAGAAGLLVQRADVVPEVDSDQRQAMVFMRDDLQPVGQRVGLVLDLGQLQCCCGPARFRARTGFMRRTQRCAWENNAKNQRERGQTLAKDFIGELLRMELLARNGSPSSQHRPV